MVAHYQPREVEHTYAGIRLKVRLRDPLAAGWYDRDWDSVPELDLLGTSRLRPSSTVFDIGAHQGVVAMLLAHRVGPEGRVIAVEASPHNAAVCRENAALNGLDQIRVESAAISDASGTIEVGTDLNTSVGHTDITTPTVTVPAVTVDELAKKHGVPDVIFIDVEGFECRALAGAADTLRHVPDCFVEIHQGCGLESFGGSVRKVFEFLPRTEYRHYAWSEGEQTPRPVEGPADCTAGRFFLVALRRRQEPGVTGG